MLKLKNKKLKKKGSNRKLQKIIQRSIIFVALGFFVILGFLNKELISYYTQVAYFKMISNGKYTINKNFRIYIPSKYNVHGIDVSVHQGLIDWPKVSKMIVGSDSISFSFIKASEGRTMKDKYFDYNWFEAKDNNLIRGAYHFYLPGLDPKEQARNFTHIVQLSKGDLPPVLDIEKRGSQSYKNFTRDLLIWLKIIEETYGVKPIIYTNLRFYEEHFNNEKFSGYLFWIAHYYVQDLNTECKWQFWQHNDRGRVDGINTLVDFNAYNKSLNDLKDLTLK